MDRRSAGAFYPLGPTAANSFFHAIGVPNFFSRCDRCVHITTVFRRTPEAISVIYRPETALQSHYSYADLVEQFDAAYHFDVTRAVSPLERIALACDDVASQLISFPPRGTFN
jgi:hypothetical protein